MSEGSHLYRWRFGDMQFDEARLELRVSGLPVDVEQKPLQVLAQLLRHAGEVVTKEELFETVWQGRVTVDHVLATAIGKLRKDSGRTRGSRPPPHQSDGSDPGGESARPRPLSAGTPAQPFRQQ